MDHDRIAAQLCRSLRGHRSQVQLARRLGYRSNVPASWEAGRSAPPTSTFFRACERLDVSVLAGLTDFLGTPPDELDQLPAASGVAALVRGLRGSLSTVALAAKSGLSRHALGRWQRGEAEPRLPDLLRVVDHATGRLLDFVAVFVEPDTLPDLREPWRRLREARSLLVRAPWVQPVLLGLELAAYQALPAHDSGWLSARLALPRSDVEQALRELASTDQIRWTGTHWALHRVRTIDTRRDAEGVIAMRAWFAQQGLQRLRDDQQDATFSQNLFTLSTPDLERLRALHVAHFREVRRLVADSEPGDRIVWLQRSIVPWDHPTGEVE